MICYFRVEAYPKIGTGHLARCRMIASYFQAQGMEAHYLVSPPSQPLLDSWQLPYTIVPPDQEVAMLQRIDETKPGKKVLITDGDHPVFYEESYQQAAIDSGFILVTITMRNQSRFLSHIIHNQNIIALQQRYQTAPYTQLLLGPKYMILHEKFRAAYPKTEWQSTGKRHVFINFGGADHLNLTIPVYEELIRYSEQIGHITIVVGALYANLGNLQALIARYQHLVSTELHVNTNQMLT